MTMFPFLKTLSNMSLSYETIAVADFTAGGIRRDRADPSPKRRQNVLLVFKDRLNSQKMVDRKVLLGHILQHFI